MNNITVTIEVPSEEQEHVAQMLSSSINRIIFNHPNVKVRSQILFVTPVGERKRTTVGRGHLELLGPAYGSDRKRLSGRI